MHLNGCLPRRRRITAVLRSSQAVAGRCRPRVIVVSAVASPHEGGRGLWIHIDHRPPTTDHRPPTTDHRLSNIKITNHYSHFVAISKKWLICQLRSRFAFPPSQLPATRARASATLPRSSVACGATRNRTARVGWRGYTYRERRCVQFDTFDTFFGRNIKKILFFFVKIYIIMRCGPLPLPTPTPHSHAAFTGRVRHRGGGCQGLRRRGR